MADVKYDVLGIGNALFDVLVQTDESLSGQARHDQGRHVADRRGAGRRDLHATWARRRKCPAARLPTPSSASAASGARAAYVGKVKDDQIGKLYVHDIRAAGVAFNTPAGEGRPCDRLLLHPGDR